MSKAKLSEVRPITPKENAEPVPTRALSPFEEMDRLFDHFLSRAWPRGWMNPMQWERQWGGELPAPFAGRWPKVDVIDRETEIVVRAEVPGIAKEDLDLSVTDNSVTIRGCTSVNKEEKRDNYFRTETSRGEFSRTVTLPSAVDGSKAKAKLDNGILELTMPKVESAKRKNISIE